MREIIIEDIKLNVSDGTSMTAFAARPKETSNYPGLMVFQEAFGVNTYIKDITERFAREGFIAVAPELFHRTAPGFEGSYDNYEEVKKHTQAITVDNLIADISAAYNWLKDYARILPDQIASIGFCLGGRVSFLANTSFKLKAAISFYGGNITSILDRVPKMEAPQLMFWGGLDKHIGQDQVSTITGTLKEKNINFVNVIFSNADHGFFCDARSSYNPDASKQAWALTNSFLKTYVKIN
jgi:carboxymethylenebutenolidase